MFNDNSLLPAGFIYDRSLLAASPYSDDSRAYQGIPGIEITPTGRIFTVFYTGMYDEGNGNFLLVHVSDGTDFMPLCAVTPPTEDTRCFDPTLWLSPDGRLWLFWSQSVGQFDGRCGVWCAVCDDPDAAEPRFGAPRRIANGIMMNKPIMIANGDWLLPCAIWAERVCHADDTLADERYSNVYISSDNGSTFALAGKADYEYRHFDEHMLFERRDGAVMMYIRGTSDIGTAISTGGGQSFGDAFPSGISNPNSRFAIRRTPSGRLLLVNHEIEIEPEKQHKPLYHVRNKLTAYLSDDDGATYPYKLMLDERVGVSYPDVAFAPDGTIHVIYDYNRYTDKEILCARITEADIIAGELVGEKSALRVLINKAHGRKPT